MIGLPKTTEFNKRIPKQKFYENMNISPTLKKIFVEQVRIIYWKNKISTSTTNLASGTSVTELEVFEVRLNNPELDERLLKQIDKAIPYHILYLLEYQGKYQAWIGYKEVSLFAKNTFKVNGYYHTDWLSEDKLPLKLEGLNLDTIYENFVRQIAGDNLITKSASEDLKESIERDVKRKMLQKQIDKLQNEIRKEKQLNKQIESNMKLKELKRRLRILYEN